MHGLAMYAAFAIVMATTLWGADAPPPSPKRPVTDTYHGVTVTEDYRWLEDVSNPEVHQWTEAQNVYARRYLDALSARSALAEHLQKLMTHPSARYSELTLRRGVLFALLTQPPKQQPVVVSLKNLDDPASAH